MSTDNLTISYGEKQIDVSFSYVCPVVDNVMTKVMINNRTDARKIDVNLSIKIRSIMNYKFCSSQSQFPSLVSTIWILYVYNLTAQ